MDIVGQCRFHDGMQAHLVAHMGEVGSARIALSYEGKRLGEAEVGEMLFLTQRIDNQQIERLQFNYLCRGDEIHVGNVCQALTRGLVHTVAEDGKIFVHTAYGCDCQSTDNERCTIRNVMESDFGQTRVDMRFKNIVVVVLERSDGLGVGINLHVAFLDPVEGTDIVYATDMVAVSMGDEDGFKVLDVAGKHLGSEVGAYVDKDVVALTIGDKGGGSQTFVTTVDGAADLAVTCYYGHSLRSARTKERDCHGINCPVSGST